MSRPADKSSVPPTSVPPTAAAAGPSRQGDEPKRRPSDQRPPSPADDQLLTPLGGDAEWVQEELARLDAALVQPPKTATGPTAQPPQAPGTQQSTTRPVHPRQAAQGKKAPPASAAVPQRQPVGGDVSTPVASTEPLDVDGPKPLMAKLPESEFRPEDVVAISCWLCATRFYATFADVGKKKTCPDCHSSNEVKPPKSPSKRRSPTIDMNVEFGLSPVTPSPTYRPFTADQLSPTDLSELRREPPLKLTPATPAAVITLRCPRCQAVLIAPRSRIGQQLACPECQTPVPIADAPDRPSATT